jgi:gliding motility-associated-like protein
MNKNVLLTTLMVLAVGIWSFGQTPNNCTDYTTVGSSSSSYNPGPNAGCTGNVSGQVSGSAGWTGLSCAGTLVSTVTGAPVNCLTLAYTAVNTNDFATITIDNGGGPFTITGVNLGISGNVIGPYNCGGSYGDVSITICSATPFTTVTLTNTGCTSGWVINCAAQTGCGGGGGGGAGADSLTTVCGGTIDLDNLVTGDPGGTWTETTAPPSGQFNIGTGVFDAGAAGVGTYTFEYEVTGGCAGTDIAVMTVEVVAPADATWTPPTGVCANDPDIDLNTLIGGTTGGTWSGTGVTGSMFDPSAGTQTVTYTVGTAPCDDVSAQVINITPALDPSWTSPGTICEADGTIDLNALITGDTGGTWSGTGVTGNTFDPSGLNGAVQVTYTIGAAPCTGVSTQDIIVSPIVDPTWVAPTTLCDVDPLFDLNTTITGSTGGTWSGTGVTGSSFNPASGTQSVTYTVGIPPCEETLTLTVNVGVTPDPSWTAFTVCLNDPMVDLDTTITGDPGGTWSGIGVTGNMFDPSVGPQSITYTVTNGNCSADLSQTITGLNPNISLTSTNATCFGLNDGSASVTTTGGSGNYAYSWNTNPVQTTSSISNIPPGTYTVTVTDLDANCVNIDSVVIISPDSIAINMTGNNACSPMLGSAVANASGGVGGFTYAWNDTINTTANAVSLDSGYAVVTVTDGNGCTGIDSVLIQVFPDPVVTITPDTTIIWGDFFQLNATGGVTYNWSPNDYLDCDDCQNPIAAPDQDITYCVNVVDANGCVKDTCTTIFVEIVCGDVFVPSAFSPNDDGENDFLCVYSDCWENLTFKIYNRWGEVVFTNTTEGVCWDGRKNGVELNSAVFVYTLDGYLINGQPVSQKGNISLIR